jgi:hypothetical protein
MSTQKAKGTKPNRGTNMTRSMIKVGQATLFVALIALCSGCAELLNTIPEARGDRTCPYCGAYYPSAYDFRNHVPTCGGRR